MKTIQIAFIVALILRILSVSSGVYAQGLTGQLGVVSNYIEHGVSQSDSDPSLQAQLIYSLNSNFSLNVFGASVSYPSNDEHITIRPSLKFFTILSAGYSLALEYQLKNYYGSSARNSNLLSATLGTPVLVFTIENDSKFEGASSGVTSFGARRRLAFADGVGIPMQLSYNQVKVDGLKSYFDAQAGVDYVQARWSVGLLYSLNSETNQFGDRSKNVVYAFLKGIF